MFYSSWPCCDTKGVSFHLVRNLNIFGYKTEKKARLFHSGFLFFFFFGTKMAELDGGLDSFTRLFF